MSSCAVIGANGFLGQAVIKQLTVLGHAVYCVYNKAYADLPADARKIQIIDFIKAPVAVDFIFFAAGSFSSTHAELVSLNCDLLKSIVDICPESRIIYISSTNVYGFQKDTITETSPFISPALYGRSKLAGEFIVSAAKNYAILRLTYLYGKGLNNRSFLPNIIQQASEQKKIMLHGKGQREQDYLHVDDAASLCIRAMDCGNDIFLGATGVSYSNLQVARSIAGNIDNCVITFQGEDTGTSIYFDPSETFRRSGWKPAINFIDGIKNMIH